jgi:hypothetical protein
MARSAVRETDGATVERNLYAGQELGSPWAVGFISDNYADLLQKNHGSHSQICWNLS